MPKLLPNPETGSANPSASFPALQRYIQLALQPKNCPRPLQPGPAINVSYHMGIRTAVYNYFTTQVSSAPPPPSYTAKGASAPALSRGSSTVPPSEYDIYDRPDNTSWMWRANCSSAPRKRLWARARPRTVLHPLLHRRAVHQPSAELVCELPEACRRRG